MKIDFETLIHSNSFDHYADARSDVHNAHRILSESCKQTNDPIYYIYFSWNMFLAILIFSCTCGYSVNINNNQRMEFDTVSDPPRYSLHEVLTN